MDILATEASTLTIGRLRAEYLLSAEHPSPVRVKAQLDTALTNSLSQMLTMLTARWDAASDSTVLLIRRLTISLDVNTTWERDSVARNWAVQLLRSLEAIREGVQADENIAWFADRSAYLAHFLLDVAHGTAWDKWYYAPFDGLRLLSTSATLRTALCFQPALGLAALLQLKDLSNVLEALTAPDARTVVEQLATAGDGGQNKQMACLEALWRLWDTAASGADEWSNVLRLYLAAVKADATLAGETLKTSARALLRLARRSINASPVVFAALLNALQHTDTAALYLAAGASDAEAMMPLMSCSSDLLQSIGESLRLRYSEQGATPATAPGERAYTAFGGLFLLLPILAALPLEQAAHDWPALHDASPVAALRLLLFMKCCGHTQAHRVFADSLVRDVLGVDSALSPARIAHWQRHISSKMLTAFLTTITTWQQTQGAVDGRTLVLGRATLPGSAIAVLLDCRRGAWLAAHSYQRQRIAALLARLYEQLIACGQEDTLIVSEELFVPALRSAYPSLHVEPMQSDFIVQSGSEDQALQAVLKHYDKLSTELSYLALPRAFYLSRPLDLALSVAAQHLMRLFAWRLPGFAHSGLPYLYSNFLNIAGSLQDEPARRVVRLGEPPLNFILNLSAINRATYRLPWLDERPFALFREE